jgi:peptide/nickel transport system substrate-binding protein
MNARFALALLAALCITGAAACTKVGTSTGPAAAPPGTIPGVLRYADIQEPSNMNPILRTEAIGTDLDMFIMGYFFNVDDKMNYVPELATEVPTLQNGGISKDGLTITYHLRKGVKWQDGAPFTSRDPIFTWKAIMNPKNNVETRNGWDQIASVDAVGDYEIQVHMKRIFGPAIATFWNLGGLGPVLPAHLLEQYPDLNRVPFNTHPIGTGPFKFVRWNHGDRIELEANPNYWRGAPKLKRIVFKIIPNDNTILVQLKTHEIDAWFRVPSALYPQVKPLVNQGYNVQVVPTLGFSHFDLNMKNPLFADIRVRQAIHYAIDTQKIITDISHGIGVPAQADIAPYSFSWAYNPNAPWFHYDPTKANQLLDEAGWALGPDGIRSKNGTRLAFSISAVAGGKTGEATEALMLADFKKVGIAATIKNYPANLFFATYGGGGILQKGLYDTALYAWLEGVDPDDNSLYTTEQIPPKGQNSLYWSDPIIDQAELGQLSSLDPAVRKKYFWITQDEVAKQSVTDVLYFSRYPFVTSTAFHGFKPAPVTTSNWNSWEWSVE